MDIMKLSTDWAKAEVFSGKMVWFFALVYIFAAFGFFYLGRTAMAKAFFLPLLVAGCLLIAIGAGLFFANKPRIIRFEKEYQQDPGTFIAREIQRTAESKKQLTLVFKILPVIIIVAALIILLLPDSLAWRAIAVTLIATIVFLMFVDSNTEARNSAYHSKLIAIRQ
jgi:ABC-2 type transport system permease protein